MTPTEIRALRDAATKEPEIAPCPFCGHEPYASQSGKNGEGLMIECCTIGCVNPHVSVIPPSDAIAAWNRRADLSAPAPRDAATVALADPEGHWGDMINAAVLEAEHAMRKYPQPNYVISKIAEEAGEVVRAAIHCAEGRETMLGVRAEMRQLVAMLFRLWMEGDQVHGLPPVSSALTAARAWREGQPVQDAGKEPT